MEGKGKRGIRNEMEMNGKIEGKVKDLEIQIFFPQLSSNFPFFPPRYSQNTKYEKILLNFISFLKENFMYEIAALFCNSCIKPFMGQHLLDSHSIF